MSVLLVVMSYFMQLAIVGFSWVVMGSSRLFYELLGVSESLLKLC